MGFWDTPEEEAEKAELQELQQRIAQEGLSNIVSPADYQKIIIEQNQAMINLLQVIGITNSGIAGDAFVLMHQKGYYEQIKKVIKP